MRRKNKAAQELGRRGGKARARNLTAERQSEIGRQAANARWARKKMNGCDPTDSNAGVPVA